MLKRTQPENYNVLNAFLERKKPFPVYTKVVNTISGNTVYNSKDSRAENGNHLYCIYDFPDYLKGEINSKKPPLKTEALNFRLAPKGHHSIGNQ